MHQSFPSEGEKLKDKEGGFKIAGLFWKKKNTKTSTFDKLNINKWAVFSNKHYIIESQCTLLRHGVWNVMMHRFMAAHMWHF